MLIPTLSLSDTVAQGWWKMRTLWIVSCVAVLSVAIPTTANAQGAPSAVSGDKERARALADKGYGLFEAGQYQQAIQAFQEAESHFHAPTILLMIARAHGKLGQLIEARAVYLRIIDEQLAHYAPPEFFEAQQTARSELAEISRRTPSVEVIVRGAGAEQARVTLDGADVPPAQRQLRNPGSHTVVVIGPDGAQVTREVTLAEGAGERVEVDLAPGSAPQGGVPADTAPAGGSIVPAVVAFGVAGLGLGVGTVTGAMTFGKVGTLEDNCPSGSCPPSQEDSYNSAQTLATVSTVSFVLAGVAAGAGVVLLVLRPGEAPKEQVEVVAAPAWLGVRGAF
jgi:hypothetical protein